MAIASRTAFVLTIGNEIVAGDIDNTNGSWLARRLGELGLEVRLLAAVRDEITEICAFLDGRDGYHHVFVTGGLGATPDDVTREAVATAFGVECVELPALAAVLRERFASRGLAEYAARWARVPAGAEPLVNPRGGAPGFVIGNVVVLPGLPAEMRAMFDSVAERFRGTPIGSWRRTYRTAEGGIVTVLEEATARHPAVSVGSYPRFLEDGPETDVVLRCADAEALAEAASWVEAALEQALAERR